MQRKDIEINVERDAGFCVEAHIDPPHHDGFDPLYTEYNVTYFARALSISGKIDQQQIGAQLEDGVLTLTLKKAKDAMPRRIEIG